MERFTFATWAAWLAFKSAWREHDPDRQAAERFINKQNKRQEELSSQYECLSESDQHFMQSFANNLPGRPTRESAERFVEVIRTMSPDAQAYVMRELCTKHPELVSVPAFAKWTRENLSLVAKFAKDSARVTE